jgi:hypothetical protein
VKEKYDELYSDGDFMNDQNSEQHNNLLVQIGRCIIWAIVTFSCVYLWNTFFASSRVPATIAPTQNVSTVQKIKPKYKHQEIILVAEQCLQES